jgi:hypothetical protein
MLADSGKVFCVENDRDEIELEDESAYSTMISIPKKMNAVEKSKTAG